MSFLSRLFGLFRKQEKRAPDRSTAATTSVSRPVAVPPAPTSATPQRRLAIGREEMLDAKSRLAGYVFRPVSLHVGMSSVAAPEFLDALEMEGIFRAQGQRKFILRITPEQWQFPGFDRFIAPNNAFLLSARDAPHWGTEEWAVLVAEIHAANGRVAVDSTLFLLLEGSSQFAEVLLLDIEGVALAGFEKHLRQIRQSKPSLQLAVTGVATWDEYRFLMSLGVSFCLGPFATSRDESDQSGEITQSRLVVIDMLNGLRAEKELSVIAEIAKHDPVVVLKLLQMANSPLSGLSRQVAALEEAMMFLGRDALYRWLSLAMFRIDASSERDEILMTIALSRAAFLENLAAEQNHAIADELFLVGLFSLMDRLFSMPVEKVLEKIHLPERVKAVLLNNEGPYVRYLLLAVAMERCRVEVAISISSALGIDSGKMLDSYSQSMAWAGSGAGEV